MYLWRRLATAQWWEQNRDALETRARDRLAVIELPPKKKITLEAVCDSSAEAGDLKKQFGGSFRKLPKDWLKKFTQPPKATKLRIGQRLIVTNVPEAKVNKRSQPEGPSQIVIPAGLAFGTGEHATTAMSLRLLEEITRDWKRPWSLADLGTGSGILALAARRFGAKRVFAVESDPLAFTTAQANARQNKAGKIGFRQADARYWRPPGKIDVIMANLYSELLIETLPNLRRYAAADARLILSGVLRTQESAVVRALYANRIGVLEVRRRGRWIAILAATR